MKKSIMLPLVWVSALIFLVGSTQSAYAANQQQSQSKHQVQQIKPLPAKGKDKNEPKPTLQTTVSTEKKKDRLLIHMKLRNTSGKDITLSYSSQKYEIIVNNENNEEVFNWSDNKAFTQELIIHDLKKDGELSFTAEWNLKDKAKKKVPKGRYTVQVKMLVDVTSDTASSTSPKLIASTVVEHK
ncbi:BsuPI-related putative proteinase inhibitor [Paenibacillus alvei]|uniref:Intracellular proteinase inhibitor BsuPI domain-containing protein n=1 Tax=Paenibacillus alvei TaxID=44250 RepID=A0A383RER1_PAEAL|nr:BsuPI-related putative proteinase inhibitor [Paenibacillus alvei]SYX84984.1 conserved exported protein of unknown function [Paenibacillus alvei]